MIKKTQKQAILEYMQAGHRITPLEALQLFGSMRLGARIRDLRDEGHNIEGQMIEVQGRIAGTCRVKQFWLCEPVLESTVTDVGNPFSAAIITSEHDLRIAKANARVRFRNVPNCVFRIKNQAQRVGDTVQILMMRRDP